MKFVLLALLGALCWACSVPPVPLGQRMDDPANPAAPVAVFVPPDDPLTTAPAPKPGPGMAPGMTMAPGATMPNSAMPGMAMPNSAMPGMAMPNSAMPGMAMPATTMPGMRP